MAKSISTPKAKAYAPMEEVIGTLKVTQVGEQLSKTRPGKVRKPASPSAPGPAQAVGDGSGNAMNYLQRALPIIKTVLPLRR